MPTYEYRCKFCAHQFEAFQPISDEPIKKCPKCGKQVERIISAGLGIIFKGSGFYSTDNKRSSSGDPSKKSDAPKDASKEPSPSKN